MLGGITGAIKSLGEKAEGILEEQKTKVEELATETKNAAAALLEQQKEKLGEMLRQGKNDSAVAIDDAKKSAIEGFEEELTKEADKVMGQATEVIDEKVEETKEIIDEKQEELAQNIATTADGVVNPAAAILDKAKGFLSF